jgi:single-strand DNA-binding protein
LPSGRLVPPPPLREHLDGIDSKAVSLKWTGSGDQPPERTNWRRVAVLGKAGEACDEYLKKGSKVLVEGRMNADAAGNPRVWRDKEGKSRGSFEVAALTVKFLSSKNSGSDESEATAEAADETDIPFWRQPKRSENDTEPAQCRCCRGSVVSHR